MPGTKAAKRFTEAVRARQSAYLDSIAAHPRHAPVADRFVALRKKVQAIARKQPGGARAINDIPHACRRVFGLEEDLRRFGLPAYSFELEKELLNDTALRALAKQRATKYNGECDSYGEVLLNCYLDLFITFTVLKSPRSLGSKPSFLINPASGSLLELDVLFEEFRLGFEVQGEHHYTDPKVQAKDAAKLALCAGHKRVLVPVNISQLDSAALQTLIVNSVKDQLGLHAVIAKRNPDLVDRSAISNKQLLHFSKLVQRVFMANAVFGRALHAIDAEADLYRQGRLPSNHTSCTAPAPRQADASPDLSVDLVYRRLQFVTAVRKASTDRSTAA